MIEFNIDDYLNDFSPYFLSLRKVEDYKIIDVELPTNWDVGKVTRELISDHASVQTAITAQNDTTKIIAIVGSDNLHTYDLLFTRLDKIITVNKEREEKNKLFKQTVKKLEQLFIDSNLDQLQNLVIDVDENRGTEIGNVDGVKINTPSQIKDDFDMSDESVSEMINKKQEQVLVEN